MSNFLIIAGWVFALILLIIILIWIFWRVSHRSLPCPVSLIALLDNPFTHRYHRAILSRLDLHPGLYVLDAGCGPGLLTVPIARSVGIRGHVLAVDIQAGMLERAKARVTQARLQNVDFLLAGIGEGKLPANTFDRALLITVLGEVPDKLSVLREIYSALKPGGFLSVTEVLPDPDYQTASRVTALAQQVGFKVKQRFGNIFNFTLNLEKSN